MASLSIRTGLLHATQNVAMAGIAQILVNRSLAGNVNPISIDDIANQLGIDKTETITHIQHLQEIGLLKADLEDLSDVSSLKAGSVSIGVEIVATLFSSAATKGDGKPKMQSLPFYACGYWYRATFGQDERRLGIWKGGHGGTWAIAYDKDFEDSAKALDALTEYTDGLVVENDAFGSRCQSLPYKGEECEVTQIPRTHEDEPCVAELIAADGTKINMGTGDSLAEATANLIAWHKGLGCNLGEPPKLPKASKAK